MKKFNEMVVIGIDHGYGNMKTANCCFPTGIMKSDTEPTFVGDLLIWNGNYYSIGVGHKEFTADKFNDEDYFITAQTSAIRFEFDDPVAWTLDGEFGGSVTDVTIQNHSRAIEMIVPR